MSTPKKTAKNNNALNAHFKSKIERPPGKTEGGVMLFKDPADGLASTTSYGKRPVPITDSELDKWLPHGKPCRPSPSKEHLFHLYKLQALMKAGHITEARARQLAIDISNEKDHKNILHPTFVGKLLAKEPAINPNTNKPYHPPKTCKDVLSEPHIGWHKGGKQEAMSAVQKQAMNNPELRASCIEAARVFMETGAYPVEYEQRWSDKPPPGKWEPTGEWGLVSDRAACMKGTPYPGKNILGSTILIESLKELAQSDAPDAQKAQQELDKINQAAQTQGITPIEYVGQESAKQFLATGPPSHSILNDDQKGKPKKKPPYNAFHNIVSSQAKVGNPQSQGGKPQGKKPKGKGKKAHKTNQQLLDDFKSFSRHKLSEEEKDKIQALLDENENDAALQQNIRGLLENSGKPDAFADLNKAMEEYTKYKPEDSWAVPRDEEATAIAQRQKQAQSPLAEKMAALDSEAKDTSITAAGASGPCGKVITHAQNAHSKQTPKPPSAAPAPTASSKKGPQA